jgi:hypothetical protein
MGACERAFTLPQGGKKGKGRKLDKPPTDSPSKIT